MYKIKVATTKITKLSPKIQLPKCERNNNNIGHKSDPLILETVSGDGHVVFGYLCYTQLRQYLSFYFPKVDSPLAITTSLPNLTIVDNST